MTQNESKTKALEERFELGEEIARGRLSTVVRARSKSTGRVVAVKILHDHFRENQAVLQRLRRELAATRRLHHPSILRIDDLIEADQVAMVMEFVEGRSVRELVQKEGRQSWRRVQEIIKKAAEALAHAHDQGIWHRDLSAHHILVSETEGKLDVKVVGFGFARVDELVGLTMHTRVLGALEAMAPERILGKSYDGRADIYSLGAVMRELITGHPPIDGGMSEAFARAMGVGSEVEELPEEVPAAARYVLERSLARDPAVRFATASQMSRALTGDYDVARWNSWAARKVRHCPSCETAIIDGISDCIECGHEFKRLVQRPGCGYSLILVLSNYDMNIFPSGQGYQPTDDPMLLTSAQFRNLMGYLGDYEDTAAFADGRWEYQWPPYILLSKLQKEEAERISKELQELGVHNEVYDPVRERGFHSRLESLRAQTGRSGVFRNTRDAILVRGIISAVFLMSFVILALATGFVPFWVVLGILLLFGSALSIYFTLRKEVNQTVEGRDTPLLYGIPLMIPPESMDQLSRSVDGVVLPRNTAQILKDIQSDELTTEIYELVVLAVATIHEGGCFEEQVRNIIVDVLKLGDELDGVIARLAESPMAELISEMESLEARLAAEEDTEKTAQLIEEKVRLFEKMSERDGWEHRAVALRTRLLKARGALLELRYHETALVSDSAESSDLDEIRIMLEAQEEVEEVVTI